MIEELRQKAKTLLSSNEVTLVIGYATGSVKGRTIPAFITDPNDVAKLIYNENCLDNLAKYLTRKDIINGKFAILADSKTLRAIVMLLVEQQVKREDIIIFALKDGGNALWELADEVFEVPAKSTDEAARQKELAEHIALTREERWKFWQEQFSKCIKCYACRQACPLCYCERCIVEKNQPQWVPSSQHQFGNFVWNIVRAYHLAGRCILCDECERACPVGIPLGLLNREMIRIAKEKFDWEAGLDPEEKPPLMNAHMEDPIDFIE